jgi:hypothetical protein
MKRIAALVFLALGCAVTAYAFQLRMYTASGPGAGLFPAMIGIGLGLLSVLWYREEARRVQAGATSSETLPDKGALIRVGLQLATLAAFVILYPLAGYLVAALALTVGTAVIAGERNWFWIAVVALVAGPGVKLLFTALGTPI